MIKHSLNISKYAMLLLIVFSMSCKSSKKMEAAKAEERARLEQEQAAKLKKQREDEARQREAEEKARREAELRRKESEAAAMAPKTKLNQYFSSISNSGSTASANSSINEALTLFASPETPVLIVISEYDGKKDYDRPTTIRDYLNYLKDQKKNNNIISDLKMDSSGKITELELKKPL
jgi:hypothetical protein